MGIYAGNGIVLMIVSLYYLLFGFALSRLVYASFANGVFDKYLNPHIEGAQVGQGLRPQSEDDELPDEDDEDEEFTPPTQRERDKYRAAQEAGLLERVLEVGWAGLTAKESGRIGGLLAHKNRE